ncbi:unnamed protein product [Meganyctiphanes norvegica]|uniref:Uncharacterized protein n=1 Tax=Meganyctiphanes norvegica TaxID=48144 RepID=A0AAV2R4S2_MEGNR
MKRIAVAAVVLVCLYSIANASEEPDMFSEIGRVFFLDSDGGITFNTTSLLYIGILAFPLLLHILWILFLLNTDYTNIFGTKRRSDATPSHNSMQQYYAQFTERSLDSFSPILEMLRKAYEKYM